MLEREPDPKPAPPEATGAVVEKKKIQAITAVAVGFGLLVAMFLGWLLMRSRPPVMAQRSLPMGTGSAVPPKQTTKLNEGAENDYDKGVPLKGRPKGMASDPAFNPNAGTVTPGGTTGRVEPVAITQKRTPKDAYEDLLAKAAEADSAVEGGKNVAGLASLSTSDKLQADKTSGKSQVNVSSHSEQKVYGIGPNVLPAGTFISCALVNKLNGDNVGPVKVQVSNDVFNPITYDLAIPQGSIFLGEAQRVSAQFQQRLAVTFDRLQITRDGKMYEIALDKIPGLDQQGATALKDKTNSHYAQIFGASLAIGAIGGLAQIGNGGSYGGYGGIDTETQIRNGISQTMAQNASQILNRFLNRMPSVTVRPGTQVVIYIPFGIDLQQGSATL